MRLPLTVASAAAVLCALPLLGSLFQGPWITGPALTVLLVAVIGVAARFLGLPWWVVHPVQAAGALFLATARHAPETAFFGVVPGPRSFAALAEILLAGRAEIVLLSSPVSLENGGIALVLLLGTAVAAIAVDAISVTLRSPALTGLPLLAMLMVPLVVDYQGVGVLPFGLAAAGFVLLLAVDGWTRAQEWGPPPADQERHGSSSGAVRHARHALRVGAVALAAALLLPAAVPGLSTDAVFTLAGDAPRESSTVTTSNPMVSMRQNLTSLSDQEILRYTSSQRRPEYLRMHVLKEFDGVQWTMSPVRASQRHQVGEEGLPAVEGRWNEEEPVETRVEPAEDTRFEFLPLPYPVEELEISGEWYADPDTHMVFSVSESAEGPAYTALGPAPDFSREELAEASVPDEDDIGEDYLALPSGIDDLVYELARDITADAETPHERAVALQNWFTGGRFHYSLEPPGVPQGADPLVHFLLIDRIGYCEQFAAAMTVMARIAGIPARVAVGYTSGESLGEGRWKVTGEHAHAWPELYFEEFGWLRFEPTPSGGDAQGSASTPDYAYPPVPDAVETGEDGSDEDSGRNDPAGEEPEERDAPEEDPTAEEESGTAGALAEAGRGRRWWLLSPAAGLVAASLLPAMLRALVRSHRWRLAATDAALAHAAWAEFRDEVQDLRLAWDRAESPRAAAQRIAEECGLRGDAREALRRLAQAEERARYAPTAAPAAGLRETGRTVRTALRSSRDRTTRLRARLLPVSAFLPSRPVRSETMRAPGRTAET